MSVYNSDCFLAICGHDERGGILPSCEGRLVRVHLIRMQVIAKEVGRADEILWDPAVWVWGCGGFGYGNEAHHHLFDSARTLRVARPKLPTRTEIWATEHGLQWWLDREYGPR